FSNSYWSPNYHEGITSLSQQSAVSLKQLHDLERLVESYVNYYTKNSELLSNMSIELYGQSSGFRANAHAEIGAPSLMSIGKKLAAAIAPELAELTRVEEPDTSETQKTTLNGFYESHMDLLSEESFSMTNLANLLDKSVLYELKRFIGEHEATVRSMLLDLALSAKTYDACFKHLMKYKTDYDTRIANTPEESIEEEPVAPAAPQTLDTEFTFPLKLGNSIFSSDELLELFRRLFTEIATTKRKIPLPGYTNLLFSSEALTKWLRKNRFLTENSRAAIEKFGQDLLELELAKSANAFFLARKFKSDGMWLEWTDLAVYLGEYDADKVEEVPDVSINLGEFYGKFTQKLVKAGKPVRLAKLEALYNEEYLRFVELKGKLEIAITTASQRLQVFEYDKIGVIYKALASLSGHLSDHAMQSAHQVQKLAEFQLSNAVITNFRREFDLSLDKTATGVYFPTSFPPEFTSSVQSSLNFQNLHLRFNLYADISLQPTLSDVSGLNPGEISPIVEDPCMRSLPLFVFSIVGSLDTKDASDAELEYLRSQWLAPFDIKDAYRTKYEVLKVIQGFQPSPEITVEPPLSALHAKVIDKIIGYLIAHKTKPQILNFFKQWLLELSDSLIPFMVYDMVKKAYEQSLVDENQRQEELGKMFSSVPRHNLSSLVFLLNHLVSLFPTLAQQDDFYENAPIAKLNGVAEPGAVPFIHLIFRPSVLRSSTGFKPDLPFYNTLLADLVSENVRTKLVLLLESREEQYASKRHSQTVSLGPRITKTEVESAPPRPPPKANNVNRLSTDNITLRPFRVTSPAATPSLSPKSSP
ncbi:hypothetical protein BABINDRAFT_27939, partial [Babjeviella inositovora NRRL Y-12698]